MGEILESPITNIAVERWTRQWASHPQSRSLRVQNGEEFVRYFRSKLRVLETCLSH